MTYEAFLKELDLSEIQAQIVMNDNIIINTTVNRDDLYLGESTIHGLGVFISKNTREGRCWIAAKGSTKYICGRFINHSDTPNCEFSVFPLGVMCIALRDLKEGEELTTNYFNNYLKVRK